MFGKRSHKDVVCEVFVFRKLRMSEENLLMNDQCIYTIQLAGQVDEREIMLSSPLQLLTKIDPQEGTSVQVITDQSGLIGLLRFIHGQGLVLLSVRRAEIGQI